MSDKKERSDLVLDTIYEVWYRSDNDAGYEHVAFYKDCNAAKARRDALRQSDPGNASLYRMSSRSLIISE